MLPVEDPSCCLFLKNFLRRDLFLLAVADSRVTQGCSRGSTGALLLFGFFLEASPKTGVGRGVV